MKLTAKKLNELAAEVGTLHHRWWVDIHTGKILDRDQGQLLMLVTSEIGEAMEGHRKDLMDDKVPTRKMVEVELTDAIIRVLDMAWHQCPGQLTDMVGHFNWSDNFASNLFDIVCRLSLLRLKGEGRAARYTHVIAMIMDLMEREGYDFWGAYKDKMNYNAKRRDHTHEARRELDGKRYG